jgi:hypothetical protein
MKCECGHAKSLHVQHSGECWAMSLGGDYADCKCKEFKEVKNWNV